MPPLSWRNVTAIPLVHGRLAFAIEVRRRMLETRWDAVLVELPPSLEVAVRAGLDRLPAVSVVLYREVPEFLAGDDAHVWYIPIDPCDGIVEALRIAERERTPVHFVDADVEEFEARPTFLPDAHALHGLGLDVYYDAIQPRLSEIRRTHQDVTRERHMAARIAEISESLGQDRRILFLGGIAHWKWVHKHLEAGSVSRHDGDGPDPSQVHIAPVHPRSLGHLLGETPHTTWRWDEHRRGIDPTDYDAVWGLKDLLLQARDHYERTWPESQEKATTRALENILDYARKLCVRQDRLVPDTWTLAQAAKGCVGNDYAVSLLHVVQRYPPNGEIVLDDDGGQRPEGIPGDALQMTETQIASDTAPCNATSRTPGIYRGWRPLELRDRPDRRRRELWKKGWNPYRHCSWPPEDIVIENFREYVARRALGLAGLSLQKTEPFTTSFKDGLALRETLRDWHRRRIHVKEEPRVADEVGALVMIFEEDDDGTRFPWRTTWMAEHDQESTLAFYSTDPSADIVGPGIGRIFYGGCMFISPPLMIPDVWDDLRFERARYPSERLLLAALFWSRERFVAYASATPPSPEAKQQAAALDRHIVYIPLSTFSATTLEKLRRAHVLNGHEVRAWADRFIR